jgi:hypothetical protein
MGKNEENSEKSKKRMETPISATGERRMAFLIENRIFIYII